MKNILLPVIVISILSCSSKLHVTSDAAGMEKAISIAIYDFAKENTNVNTAYNILINEEADNVYSLTILDNYTIYLTSSDTVGATNKYFPTKYLELKRNIYTWSDSNSAITDEILSLYGKYRMLDSSAMRNDSSVLGPAVINDHNRIYTTYFLCKQNPSIFIKRKSSKTPSVGAYPKINCD